MEDVGGRRLDWFWREWFKENPHFDQAIDTVAHAAGGDTQQVIVVVRQSRARRAADPRALHVQRRIDASSTTIRPRCGARTRRTTCGSTTSGKTLRADRARPGRAAGRHRPREQHVGHWPRCWPRSRSSDATPRTGVKYDMGGAVFGRPYCTSLLGAIFAPSATSRCRRPLRRARP